MAQVRVDVIDTPNLSEYIGELSMVLNKDPDIWLPFYRVEDILQLVEEGDYQLWVGWNEQGVREMFALTTYRTFPACRVISIVWCGGENAPAYYEIFTHAVETMGAILGAHVVEILGRNGWVRALEKLGYRPHATHVMKEIGRGKGSAQQCNADE